ncbi:MAG: L,D-transpeptidase [Verrucomicrobiae bacterium]|nr:L,D-transpeptidase [Verrucomicrobiae bacterium]
MIRPPVLMCLTGFWLMRVGSGGWAQTASPVPLPPPPRAELESFVTPDRPVAELKKSAPATTAKSADPAVSLVFAYQVLLDRNHFSPGCLDGQGGRQTEQAVMAWQQQNGLRPTGRFDNDTLVKMGSVRGTVATHRVTQSECDRIGPVPKGWKEKAALGSLPYESVLESLAEKYHTTQNALRQLNPGVVWPNPPAGTLVNVPNPQSAVPLGKAARVRISLTRKLIRVYDRQGTLIAQFPCSIAQREEKRPVGTLKVLNYAPQPNYVFNPELFVREAKAQGITRKLIIPPGPNNPVGVAWVGLSLPGYGIHGTPRPEEIGITESHGCFRLANWNAAKFLKMISIGTPVEVRADF